MSGVGEDTEQLQVIRLGLKNARRVAKAAVTKKINEIREAIKGRAADDLDSVKAKQAQLDEAMHKFRDQHGKLHRMLDGIEKEESEEYLEEMESKYKRIKEKTERYFENAEKQQEEEDAEQEKIQLGESALGSVVEGSVKSRHSSIAAHLAVAAAEKAAWKVEAAKMAEKQKLEDDERRLQRAKENLRLETELAKIEAKEAVLNEIVEKASQQKKNQMQDIRTVGTETRDMQTDNVETHDKVDHGDKVEQENKQKVEKQKNHVESDITRESKSANRDDQTEKEGIKTVKKETKDEMEWHRQFLSAAHLPKIELVPFDGDPLQYWSYICTFDNVIGNGPADYATKLSCLMQYTKGKARQAIQCCAVMKPEEGYKKARKLLEDRFGDAFLISEMWIKKVTTGPPVKAQEKERLQALGDEVRCCAETLSAMGKLSEISSQGTLQKIVSRLSWNVQDKWRSLVHKIRKNEKRNPSIHDLSDFVIEIAEIANDPVYSSQVNNKQTSEKKFHSGSFNTSVESTDKTTTHRTSSKCLKCGGDCKWLTYCEEFKALKVPDRLSFVRDKHLCFNCLKPRHAAKDCRYSQTCSVPGCGRKHSKFLHYETRDTSHTNVKEVAPVEEQKNFSGTERSAPVKVALPILPVVVQSQDTQRSFTTYALLDSGSTNTFCSEELVKELGITGKKDVMTLTTLEKAKSKMETEVVAFDISDVSHSVKLNLDRVFVKSTLPIDLNNMATKREMNFSYMDEIDVPDVDVNRVTLLIGQDNPEALIPIDVRRGNPGEPYATKTILGWTVNGPMQIPGVRKRRMLNLFVQEDYDLKLQMEKFWEVEGQAYLKEERSQLSRDDRRALDIWENSIQHREDGHYMMAIPFRHNPPDLPLNQEMAEKRLISLHRRLSQDKEMHRAYTEFMEDLILKNYAEEVEADVEGKKEHPVWYLPHHNVHHPKKPDKVRVVYDCSASYQGVSLNSEVLQGPDLLNSLIGVLIRFRQHPVAVMADIRAMFHQVAVIPEHRDVLRFLWWPRGNLSLRPEVYRMTVHLFGGTWSPSCCNFALQRTAQDAKEDFDAETVSTVLKNFYVDDCLRSFEDPQKAEMIVHQLIALLKRGGFELTKWVSNNIDVLSSIPEEDRAKQVKNLDLTHDALPVERALGVTWDVQSDSFSFEIHLKEKPLTKRGILSIVGSVYDPFGFVSPFTIVARKLMQDVTRAKLDWDESLQGNDLTRWLEWKRDLKKLEGFKIPRCVHPPTFFEIEEIQLHHFSDASQMAYGVATYLRMKDSQGRIHCCLLMAKARVAPIRQLTIPRLELSAATMAVRMNCLICKEIDLPVTEVYYWTDSTCILHYIRSEDKRFQTFVENRVSIIREHSAPSQWNYVESKNNPADDCSRGLRAEEIIRSERWLNGPSFLWLNQSEWPQQDIIEMQQQAECGHTSVKAESDSIAQLFKRRSSWYRLKKDVAWLRRFLLWIGNYRNPVGLKGPLKIEELQAAENKIIQCVQREAFGENIENLRKKNNPLRRLAPVLSDGGIIIVGSRLGVDPSKQAILPKEHPVVDLIIRDCHETFGHVGREHVMAQVRKKFWLLGGRSSVRRVLKDCFQCRRAHAPTCQQRMADLPSTRITPGEPPFAFTGIDFFGPFLVKRGRAQAKRYGCLFTCFNSRAIHIEIAYSLDTHSFINALQRFISRRGQPKEITSDNGTNFIGAERELRNSIKAWNSSKIEDFMHQKGIKWNFNPPYASHMGGVWERCIRSVRKVLGSVMKQQVVDDEGLSTLMCIVEAIVNSRPLTQVSDDPKDLQALTPNDILMPGSGPALPPGNFEEDNYSRRRWRQIQYLADLFWRRWVTEYLPTLQLRQKWLQPHRNLKEGDIVLVMDEKTPRYMWPIGRIIETYPGRDNLVRIVKIKTKSSSITRPITKVCLLEEAT